MQQLRRMAGLLMLVTLALSVGLVTQAQEITHTVAAGENLYRISLRYGSSIGAIASANGIANPNLIFVGQQLRIPGTTGGDNGGNTGGDNGGNTGGDNGGNTGGDTITYTVQPGDTLGAIARRFGTTFQDIAARNNIANPNLIFVGQQLVISGSAPPPDNGGTTEPPPTTGNPPPNTAPVSGFAIGGHVTNASYPAVDFMRSTGMTWSKRQIRWDGSTPASAFQGEIDAAKSGGFRILLGVVGDPGQIAANPTQYYQNFANFLGGLAAGGADAIEVWNEPNIEREWPRDQINGANYTQMLSAAFQTIKANNPNTLVISGAPAPTGFFSGGCGAGGCDDNAFLTQMRNAGAANFMDCTGIHYNAGAVPPSATSGAPVGSAGHYSWYYPSMVNLYRSIFPTKPLCFTEIGYLTGEGYGPLPGAFAWASGNTVAEQAQWLAEAAVQARSSGAVRLFIIWNVDSTNFGADPQAGYAIVRPNGTCPACDAIRGALGG